MFLSDAFNNRYYRRPCWKESCKIFYHNGRWFVDGHEVDRTCILALGEYDDFVECANGTDRASCKDNRDGSCDDGQRVCVGLCNCEGAIPTRRVG